MKNLKHILLALGLATASTATAQVIFETDSAGAITSRTASDFSLTMEQALAAVQKSHPEATMDSLKSYIANHYMEAKEINGRIMVHRKSPRNLNLLNPAFAGPWHGRGYDASKARMNQVDSVISWYKGQNPLGRAHEVTYEFTIDVPYNPQLKGDTVKVWMPLPFVGPRQPKVEILSTFPKKHIVSGIDRSVHNTVYMEQPVRKGQPTKFSCKVKFTAQGQWFTPEYILANIKPYDKAGKTYKKYTVFEAPHIIKMDSLAKAIVGNETNPFKQSEMVFDYIIERYPWAGAREYSTIECIPQYVIDEKHGDCGQVSLLYISLMRSLGVPARWESGWAIHPNSVGYHDWAEVYFEGIGWVPVDVSFGRMSQAREELKYFFSHGMDSYRLASNLGVCGELYPKKKFVRSETVDLQPGEVETTKGNLFYPYWDQDLKIIDIRPVKSQDKINTIKP